MGGQSDKTFSAGNEEDFIRQLQEQLAAGGDVPGDETGSTEKISQDTVESSVEVSSKTDNRKNENRKKKKSAFIKNAENFLIYFFIPALISSLSVFLSVYFKYIPVYILSVLLGAAFFGSYLVFIFKIKFRGVMDAAEKVLYQVGQGKLSYDISNDKQLQDDLGLLSTPIDRVIKETSDVITKIELSVLDIVGNSDALAYFANSMADKTTKEEDSVNKIDNFTRMINESMQTVKKNVEAAYQNSKESIDEADRSSVEILSLIEEMRAISEMSDKIVETMHVINDIADETNLLALNAAIQAAHAGDEGKGFGVVASEIRNLAESSTQATRSIFGIIDKTVSSIEKGVGASEKAKKALGKIVYTIKSTEDLMSEINKSITLQTGETNKLKGSVEDIKDLTKNINSDTQNMKAAISNLAGQAQILNTIIKRFEVHSSSVGSGAIFGVDK